MRLVRGLAAGLIAAGLAVAGGCTAGRTTTTAADRTVPASSTAAVTGTTGSSTGSVTSRKAHTTSVPTTTGSTPTTTTTPAPATTETRSLPPPAARLSGTWTGRWTNEEENGTSGTLQITWTQAGNELHGTVSLDGVPCLDGGVVNGTIAGLDVAFAVNNRGEMLAFAGHVNGRAMSGTFECEVTRGSWQAQKSA